LIFESLNLTCLDLSQADMIRNYVPTELEPEEQKRIYKKYWHPMENDFILGSIYATSLLADASPASSNPTGPIELTGSSNGLSILFDKDEVQLHKLPV
jgi:hypothetical protein